METPTLDSQIDSEMTLERDIKQESWSPRDEKPTRESSAVATDTRGVKPHSAGLDSTPRTSHAAERDDDVVDVNESDDGTDDERDAESYCEEEEEEEEEGQGDSTPEGHTQPSLESTDTANAHEEDAPMQGSDVTPTSSTSLASVAATSPPLRIRKRVRQILTPEQSQVLNAILVKTHFPSTSVREAAARQLGVSPRKVQVWFQNVRQKEKKRATMAAAAAAASRSPLGGRINLTAAPGPSVRAPKGVKTATTGGPGNRQHVVPTSTVLDSRLIHTNHGHYARDAQSSLRHGLQLQTASLDYQSPGMRTASSHPMMRSGNDYSVVGNRPCTSATEGHLPFALQRPSSSGLLSPGARRELGLMSINSPGVRTIGLEPAGRHRSASDASAMHRWQSPTDHVYSYDVMRSGTRVPVYRLSARPLTHQLSAVGSAASGALGHRHSRSTLSGQTGSQHRGTLPYWLHSGNSLRSSSDALLHSRTLPGPAEGPRQHWPATTEESEMLPIRQSIVSPQRSQPQLRTVHRARSIQSSLHRARSDYVLLPPLHDLPSTGTVHTPSNSGLSGFSQSPITSVSSSASSQVSSYGAVLPDSTTRRTSTHHAHGPYYHQHEYLSPPSSHAASRATESTASNYMDEDEEGDLSPSTPTTPDKGVVSSSVSTLAGEDELGRGRARWTRSVPRAEELLHRSTTASPTSEGSRWRELPSDGDFGSGSQQDLTSLQTPKASTYPANVQSLASASKATLRVNPWKVRAGGTPGSGSAAPPTTWQPFGESVTSRQLPTQSHHTRSAHSISHLSSRLESIMASSDEQQRQAASEDDDRNDDGDGVKPRSGERTTPVSTTSTSSGATPKRPPLRRMGCESHIGSLPGLCRSSSQNQDASRSHSFAGYSSSHEDGPRGSESELSTHESSVFSTTDSQMLTADSEDDHVSLPPLRNLLMQEKEAASPATNLLTKSAAGEAARQTSPSTIQLPSIKNLQLGV